jgi:hypothetical protein
MSSAQMFNNLLHLALETSQNNAVSVYQISMHFLQSYAFMLFILALVVFMASSVMRIRGENIKSANKIKPYNYEDHLRSIGRNF